jgi:hypothetical protein
MTRDKHKDQQNLPGYLPLADAMPAAARAVLKRPRRTLRVIQAAVTITEQARPEIVYQHSVICQCAMPLRDPGDQIRTWDREQGRVSLRIKAGEAKDPETGAWVDVGLPFGPKPRLILSYLNTQALLLKTPVIEVEDSLSAFVARIGLDRHGRNIRTVKDQLARLAAADFRLGTFTEDGRARTVKATVVEGFELWFPKNERQRVLWPTMVQLSAPYFASLQEHAVPLDLEALGALKESALALDLYAWLAQRLWRVHHSEAAFIAWAPLKEQFGPDYGRMDNFKRRFRQALRDVLAVYPAARVELNGKGMTLRHSRPPVPRKLLTSR